MPANRIEWATARGDREIHSVTFRPGPNVHEETAACGKVDRFWPRIGVYMGDRYCEACWKIASGAAAEGAMSRACD